MRNGNGYFFRSICAAQRNIYSNRISNIGLSKGHILCLLTVCNSYSIQGCVIGIQIAAQCLECNLHVGGKGRHLGGVVQNGLIKGSLCRCVLLCHNQSIAVMVRSRHTVQGHGAVNGQNVFLVEGHPVYHSFVGHTDIEGIAPATVTHGTVQLHSRLFGLIGNRNFFVFRCQTAILTIGAVSCTLVVSGYSVVSLVAGIGLEAKITAVGFHPHGVLMHLRIKFLVHRQLRRGIGSAGLTKECRQSVADLGFRNTDSCIGCFRHKRCLCMVIGILRRNISIFFARNDSIHMARALCTHGHHFVAHCVVQLNAYIAVRNHQVEGNRIDLCHLQGVGGSCTAGRGQYYRDDISSVLSSLAIGQLYSGTLTADRSLAAYSHGGTFILHSGCHEHGVCTGGHRIVQLILCKLDLHIRAVACGFQALQTGASNDLNCIGLILLVIIGVLHQTAFQGHCIAIQAVCYQNIGQGGLIALPGTGRFMTLQEHLMGTAAFNLCATLDIAVYTAVCVIGHIVGGTCICLIDNRYFVNFKPVLAGAKADAHIVHPYSGGQSCLQACFRVHFNAAADMLITTVRNIKGVLTGNQLYLSQILSSYLGAKFAGEHSLAGTYQCAALHDLHGQSHSFAFHEGLKGINSSLQVTCQLGCVGGVIEFLLGLDIGGGGGRISFQAIGRSIVSCQLNDKVTQGIRILLVGVSGDPQSRYIFRLGVQIIAITIKVQHIRAGHTLDCADVALVDTGKVKTAVLKRFLNGFTALVADIAGLNDIAVFIYRQKCKLTGLFDLQGTLVTDLIVVSIGMLTGALNHTL